MPEHPDDYPVVTCPDCGREGLRAHTTPQGCIYACACGFSAWARNV